MQRGKFIVIDGGEGTGTTTISMYLASVFGDNAIRTREPGGSPYAEKIRELILSDSAKETDAETQFALFWAARRDHMRSVIIPSLDAGKHVFCDRFDSSTWAYQICGKENPQLVNLFWTMREHYIGGYAPDLYMLLDIEPELGIARAKGRGGLPNHFDLAHIDFHKRVRKGFRDFCGYYKYAIIDASAPLAEVKLEALRIVQDMIGGGS